MSGRKSIWRDAARTPRIASVDARAFFPLVFALFHMRVWTFGVAFAVVVMFPSHGDAGATHCPCS
ncbi:IcmT/TraK family protein [Cupriavidus basilensis]